MKRNARKLNAFTLIELMVVIGITIILLGLLFVPLVNSFNLTRRAQSTIEAQATARVVLESISRELSNAVFVFDNTVPDARVNLYVPDRDGNQVAVPVQFAKVDFVPAAQGYLDRTNVPDPTVNRPLGPLTVPLAPGITIVRYFIGLQDNTRKEYINGNDDSFVAADQGDNLYVLYRAEARLSDDGGNLNRELFDVDFTGAPILNDPDFFYKTPARAAAWRAISRVVVELSNTDMIELVRNRDGIIQYDSLNRPQVRPLIGFTPQSHKDEVAAGARAAAEGIEVIDVPAIVNPPVNPNNGEHLVASETSGIAPTMFTSRRGGWAANPTVTLYRTPQGLPDDQVRYYSTRMDYVSGTTGAMNLYVFHHHGRNDPGVRQFNITAYVNSLRAGRPTFLNDVLENGRDEQFETTPFYIDPKAGAVITSFPSDVFLPSSETMRYFRFPVGRNQAVYSRDDAPTLDPDSVNGVFRDMARAFTEKQVANNQVTFGAIELDVRRYALLSSRRFDDTSPLLRFEGATIVPGSEEVIGPDQNPGPNWGRPVRYTRIPNNADGVPGPNQYKINYVPKQVPEAALDRLREFVDQFAARTGQDEGQLRDLINRHYLARFDTGYIELYSDPSYPIPDIDGNAEILVRYQFQANRPNDMVVVDYASSQLLNVTLGVRRFDPTSRQPAQVLYTSSVQIRNFLR